MKRKDTKKFPSGSVEGEEELLEAKEYEAEAPALEEFQSRRRGPDLRLPLGLLITFLLMGGLGYFLWQYMQTEQAVGGGTLILNEVCTANHKSLVSETLDTPDWVELYNGTGKELNLKGYGLTDNPKQSYKYILPDVTMAPGGYLLVYFTGGTEAADADPLCTGFGLSRYGENLLLVDANYNLLDSVEVPSLEPDVSYARMADGSWGYAVIPTPGRANGEDIIPAWK
ncbi:MAG: lamin tail domain-containing protein [Clostridia bacterium]|nr:lamin tail domain-containing protein [Clostridia bacterium]MBR0356441.1 lamin tail domain-containing protein [Clostridia bacterium]